MKKLVYVDYPHDRKRGVVLNNIMRGMTMLAVFLMIISSVKTIEDNYSRIILTVEMVLSCVFFIDFTIRAYLSGGKKKFFTNAFNIFDLLASVPFIIAFILQGYLMVNYLKILRIVRLFRIFRLGKYFVFLSNLFKALKKNAYKYKIAGMFFLISFLISSFFMYAVEGQVNPGFADIPNSMRRAIVTMSTVGYGDVTPITILGKIVGGCVMLLGPIFVAIISSISIITFLDVMKFINSEVLGASVCEKCSASGHDDDAHFCRICGQQLSSSTSNSYILDNY